MYPRQGSSLLQRYITENKLEEKDIPIKELHRLEGTDEVILGVDGTKIIDVITQSVWDKEKMSIYTYTTPFTVYEKLGEICANLKIINTITKGNSVIVFNGIHFSPDPLEESSKENPPQTSELSLLSGTDASRICNIPSAKATEIQTRIFNRFLVEEDVENQIVKTFRSEFKDTMRAPYLAWAQLSALRHPTNRFISEVYGCLELLAFPGIDRVITNFDMTKCTFDMVRKSRLLQMLQIDEDDLASLIMIDSRSRLMKGAPQRFSNFDDMCKKIVRIGDFTLGASFATQFSDEMRPQNMMDNRSSPPRNALFRNLAALISPVLTVSAPHCMPLNYLYGTRRHMQDRPERFFGSPFPALMHYILTAGLLSPSLFASLCQGSLVDGWPLVDSVKYRNVAQIVLPLRVQTVYQLASFLNFEHYQMTWIRRYNVLRARVHDINSPPKIALDRWDLSKANITQKIFPVDVMEYANLATSAQDTTYQTVEETCAGILLESLDLLGYLTHVTYDNGDKPSTCEASSFGRALRLCTVPTLSEYTVLLIELARTGSLSTETFQMTNATQEPRQVPLEIILASRILSIIPLNVSGPWTGPIDVELAAFSMISRMISRSLRHLFECLMVTMICEGRTSVPLTKICDIQQSLPFSVPVEFCGGVLIEYILRKERCTIEDLKSAFPECSYLNQDLATLFYFWHVAFEVLQFIDTGDTRVDLECLIEADKRMRAAQENLNIDTGVKETYY